MELSGNKTLSMCTLKVVEKLQDMSEIQIQVLYFASGTWSCINVYTTCT